MVSDLAADADEEFTFTVPLADDSISGTYGDMTFENGVATVTLKGGESATAEGLPTTLSYTVEEAEAEGFTSESENAEGEISKEAAAEAKFTNTRDTGDLTVSKVLVSDVAEDADEEFTFTVTLADDSISGTYGDMTFEKGVATVTLKGGESATAEGLPTTLGYTVEEAEAEGYEAESENAEGEISAEGVTATITNTRQAFTIEVTVNKRWDDFGNAAGLRPNRMYMYLYQNGALIYTVRITAAAGWTATVTDLPQYDEDGNEYTYFWREDSVDNYIMTGYNRTGNVTTFTNTLFDEPETPLGLGNVFINVGDFFE